MGEVVYEYIVPGGSLVGIGSHGRVGDGADAADVGGVGVDEGDAAGGDGAADDGADIDTPPSVCGR